MKAEDLILAFTDELGDAADLVREEQVLRWINRGRTRLGLFDSKQAALAWADLAVSVPLPADCVHVDRVVAASGTCLPPHLFRSASIDFLDPSVVSAGSATLYYGAEYPKVDGANDSTLPALADEATISFALSRFFQRLASSRALFRRYVTITGQSGVDVQDLVDLANQHESEFIDARSSLTTSPPSTFFAE